jgi:excisionase family DNA binding protein
MNEPRGTPVANAKEGLTIAAAARELGVHRQTIYNWIRAGKLPVTRFGPTGGIVRVHPDDLEEMRNPG